MTTGQPGEPSQPEISTVLRAFERRSYTAMQEAAQALSETYPTSPFGWKALGLALLLAGSAQKALAPLQRALGLKADDPEVFFYLAAAWRGLGQADRALASYASAIELRPGYGEAHFELGTMLVGLKRFTQAEPHFRHSIAANPQAARGHMGLGVALRHLDRLEEAEKCFRHALSLEPSNPNGHYNLGNFLRDAGRFVDTAAVMTLCDLVITSDTAAAHLAGALGVRTWVALKAVPDWRWMLERDDSPWYPTLRLFRQRRRGDWEAVFGDIEAALKALL